VLYETDGSLGTHLRKLEDASCLDVREEFRDRRPVPWYSLTKTGFFSCFGINQTDF
jgi:DNA-binding PadR family transcriptional regulator